MKTKAQSHYKHEFLKKLVYGPPRRLLGTTSQDWPGKIMTWLEFILVFPASHRCVVFNLVPQ